MFDDYTRGTNAVFAIIATDSFAFKSPMPRTQLSHIAKRDINVPQSYSRFADNSVLQEAMSVLTLLQSTL